jgi:hypothetical protein
MRMLFTCLLLGAAILTAQQVPSQDKPPVVRSIAFHMNPLTVADILDRFHERRLRLAVEKPYSAGDVEKARTFLAEMLTEQKVPFKEVRAEAFPIPPRSMGVTFTLIK